MRIFALVVAAPLIALLAACGTPRSAPPAAGAPVPPAPAPRTTLAYEQLRLAALFRGTPVTFGLQQDSSLRATVPRRFSFDAGSVRVKPPLAAVLDRLAKGQLQTGTRMRVTAPGDPATGGGTLARDRAMAVRDYLTAQGIAAARLQAGAARQTEQVEIVVSEGR